MPNRHLTIVVAPSGEHQDIFLWNVNVTVGMNATATGLDVKLVQYLLYRYAMIDPLGPYYPINFVDGKFGPKTRDALLSMQNFVSAATVRDGKVSPMVGTGLLGAIYGLRYNMLILNAMYYQSKTGMRIGDALLIGITDISISDQISDLWKEPDLPSDLRGSLIHAMNVFR